MERQREREKPVLYTQHMSQYIQKYHKYINLYIYIYNIPLIILIEPVFSQQVLVSALRLHTAERVLSACLATLQSLTASPAPVAKQFGFAVLAPKTPRECGLATGWRWKWWFPSWGYPQMDGL